jgi:phage tail sheath gpL-like
VAIQHSLTASTRRPIRSVEFNIASAQRGLVPLDGKLLCVGTQSTAATATAEEVNEVFSEADADTKYGVGSPLALMLRTAFRAARLYGKAPRIYGCGVAAPSGTGDVADEQTITITGPATEAKNLRIRIAGREIVVGVANAAVQNDIAADLEAAIDEKVAELPVTAAVSTNVVTTTAVAKGENGGDILIEVLDKPAGVSVAIATDTAGAGVIDITNALDATATQNFDVVAIENHKSADMTDLATHLTTMWGPTVKRFRWAFVGEITTLATAQALATAADAYNTVVISQEGGATLPGELAAGLGAIAAGEDDPALPFHGLELLWPALPKDPADDPTDAELESGIAGGLWMLEANATRTRVMASRAVTTKVTHASVPFYALLDLSISRSMVYAARQVDISQAIAMSHPSNKKITDESRARLRTVAYNTLKSVEELDIVQDVDDHAGELTVEVDPVVNTRLVTSIPTSVVPPLVQVANVFNLIQE